MEHSLGFTEPKLADRRAKDGGPDRDRTGDLMNAIHARSQLRYWPTFGERITIVSDSGLPDRLRAADWWVGGAFVGSPQPLTQLTSRIIRRRTVKRHERSWDAGHPNNARAP